MICYPNYLTRSGWHDEVRQDGCTLTYLTRHESKSGLRLDLPRHGHQAILMPEPLSPPHRRLTASVFVRDHRPELYEHAYDSRSATSCGFYEGCFPRAGFVVHVGLPPFHESSDRFHVTSETFSIAPRVEGAREMFGKLRKSCSAKYVFFKIFLNHHFYFPAQPL